MNNYEVCQNCKYEEKSAIEEPCRNCFGNNSMWEQNDRGKKLKRLEKLCKEYDCCADCPVTDNEDTESLCANFAHENLSESSIDIILNILENDAESIKTRLASIGADTKVERHKEICEEVHKLYELKNHDYGDSFGKGFQEYGLIMPVIRLEDKLNRFKQLVNREGMVKDESVEDTLIDLANYAIMTVLEMREGE